MTKNKIKLTNKSVVFIFSLAVLLTLGYQNCGKNPASIDGSQPGLSSSELNNQNDDDSSDSSFDGTSSGNPTVNGEVLIEPFNGADTVFLCIDHIRMDPVGPEKEFRITNDILLELNSNGTSNSELLFEEGTYEKLSIEVDDECDIGASVQIVTDSGTRATDEEIDLVFTGLFTVNSSQQLILNIQNMITATEGLTDSDEIATAIENIEGNIGNN